MDDLKLDITEVEKSFTRIEVAGAHLGPHLTLWGGRPCAHRVATGDAVFDSAVEVEVTPGHQAMALALLNHATRRLISSLVRQHGRQLTLRDGCLRLELRGSLLEQGPLLTSIVQQCLAVGRGLSLELERLADALAANARTDPHADVRLRNLETLGVVFRGSPTARGAGASALSDGDARIRGVGAALTQGPSVRA